MTSRSSVHQATRPSPLLRWLPLLSHRRARIGIPLGYLVLIAVAEVLILIGAPNLPEGEPSAPLQAGLVLHGVLLVTVLVLSALTAGDSSHRLFLGLALAPLIRILSLVLPLKGYPQLHTYPPINTLLLVASALLVRVLGYSRQQLGLTLSRLPLQLLVGLSGIVFGAVEYWILNQEESLLLDDTWVAAVTGGLILLVFTGFSEELMFRGLIQRASIQTLGRFGMLYTALLFATLHITWGSSTDIVFVFSVALFFGWVAEATWSLLGVTLAHGITNIMLFLVMPWLWPLILGLQNQ